MSDEIARDRTHRRHVMLFHWLSKVSVNQTQRRMAEVYKENPPNYHTIERWFDRFDNGDFSLEEEEKSGRPMELDLATLQDEVEQDPFQSTRDLAKLLSIDHSTIVRGLKKIGKKRKLGRWIPHALTQHDIDRRIDDCTTLLTLKKGTKWLDHLITGDEKWIKYSNDHRRAQWVDVDEEPEDVPKEELHPKKLMLCVWWSIHGVHYWELLPVGSTINAEVYAKQLRKVKAEVEKSALAGHKVYFQHDNARPHVARKVKSELSKYGWTILPHPPYSPDLAPSDYHLFSNLQLQLQKKDFENRDEVESWLKTYFKDQLPEFWKEGIHKLPERWQKVIDTDGAYV
jgi:histone-lysine N-methyltransferase SETMAR